MVVIHSVDCKLLLIGNSSAGKTNLLVRSFDKRSVPESWCRFLCQSTNPPSDPQSHRWLIVYALQVHNMEVNGRRVKLSIWVCVS